MRRNNKSRFFRRFDSLRSDGAHEDANVFLQEQVQQIKATNYNRRYPQLKSRQFVPIDNSIDRATPTVKVRSYSQVGVAKLLATYADDLPRSDVKVDEMIVKVKGAGDSYGYGLDEIRFAQKAGQNLDAMKGAAARRGMEILFDRVLAIGDTDTGMLGLLNQPNALTFTVPNGGGGTADWASKTPREILDDMIGICEYIATQTNEVESANTLLLPRDQFVQVSTTPMQENASEKTILDFFRANYPGINVQQWLRLATAGSGSGTRMVAYRLDPEYLQGLIPQEFEQLPVQEDRLEFLIPCHGRIGGVVAYYPLSIAYGDGI